MTELDQFTPLRQWASLANHELVSTARDFQRLLGNVSGHARAALFMDRSWTRFDAGLRQRRYSLHERDH
ncbi:hypothetical protein SDC9_206948 [bioreactor metagenome]|uniref:Uncharacterized protein n=1 Tax=bioreactor metagenome TaxID=1076179 RepID=A0A645J752_9ZZZZ